MDARGDSQTVEVLVLCELQSVGIKMVNRSIHSEMAIGLRKIDVEFRIDISEAIV